MREKSIPRRFPVKEKCDEQLKHAAYLPPVLAALVGMLFSFVAGLGALRWLSRWLERGRWHFFGYYCLVASVTVLVVDQLLR